MPTMQEIHNNMSEALNKDTRKDNPRYVKYILQCARPSWIVDWKDNFEYNAFSHVDAMVNFYEKVKESKIKMKNGKYLDLYEYALDNFKIKKSASISSLFASLMVFSWIFISFFSKGRPMK